MDDERHIVDFVAMGLEGRGMEVKGAMDGPAALKDLEDFRPDVVVLVTGDADFAYLAMQLRRRGIRVEVAAAAPNLGSALRGAANEVIDLVPLFEAFEPLTTAK